jgi:tRNA threonylcarbamoyladenosine biosynthesis protein TsaE
VRTPVYSDTVEETKCLGEALARALAPDGILLLFGDLGSGKTVLTQGVATGLGIESTEVQSPTFTLIREHHGLISDLIHVDLYRIEGEAIESLGLWDLLGGPGVKVIEWSERLPFDLDGVIRARLSVEEGGGRRKIVVETDDEDEELRDALLPLSAQKN